MVDTGLDYRIHQLEASRRQAEENVMFLQKHLDVHNAKEDKERLLGYELSSNKRLLDIELDARINQYRAGL